MAPRYVLRWHNPDDVSQTWHRDRRQDLWRRTRMCNYKARLTQSARNLKVVGSSLIVGVQYFLYLSLIYLFFVEIFSFMPLLISAPLITLIFLFSCKIS
jgi:hypothetical protein